MRFIFSGCVGEREILVDVGEGVSEAIGSLWVGVEVGIGISLGVDVAFGDLAVSGVPIDPHADKTIQKTIKAEEIFIEFLNRFIRMIFSPPVKVSCLLGFTIMQGESWIRDSSKSFFLEIYKEVFNSVLFPECAINLRMSYFIV